MAGKPPMKTKTYVRVHRNNIPKSQLDQLYAAGSVLDLDDEQIRMLFLVKEAKIRGYFRDNDLAQISDGQEQLPLLTWSFLDYLSTRQLKKQTLIELGAGNSTLWFAQRFSDVVSYETNPAWVDQVRKVAPINVKVNLIEIDSLESAKFDLQAPEWLLIDFAGRRTKFIKCLMEQKIYPTNIILDNSDRYRNGAGILIEAGYTEIPFFGFKSGQTWISCTSLFIRELTHSLVEGEFKVPSNAKVMIGNTWDDL